MYCFKCLGFEPFPQLQLQGALPAILEKTPQSFFEDTVRMVEENAEMAFKMLSEVAGLNPVMPSGAMYMMVGIDRSLFPQFENDLQVKWGEVTAKICYENFKLKKAP